MSPKSALEAMWESGLMLWTVRLAVDELVKFGESLPKDYNGFKRATFLKWLKDNKEHIQSVEFGREYSPVAYVISFDAADLAVLGKGQEKLKADEFDVVDHRGRKALRIWWD